MANFKQIALTGALAAAGATLVLLTNYISRDEYVHEQIHNEDKPYEWLEMTNPHNNVALYDHFEKVIDAKRTKEILAKYKTNEEMISALQKALYTGPAFIVHRNILAPYLRRGGDFNRLTAFRKLQPEFEKLDFSTLPTFLPRIRAPIWPKNDDLNYLWTNKMIRDYKAGQPFTPLETIVYGSYLQLENGVREDGGYFDFVAGSDMLFASSYYRIEYYTKKNERGEEELAIRKSQVTTYVPEGSKDFIDSTLGGHELLTRLLVLDMVRGI